MKAIFFDNYGAPEVLYLQEIDNPIPKFNEIRIKLHATAVNSGDIRMRKADPFAVRFMLGLVKPRKIILGVVFAGEIDAVGSDVSHFKEGDQVYGTSFQKFSTYAEYLTLPESDIICIKPDSLNYGQAATVPFGATTALHFLRAAHVDNGTKVLIHGASGAVGTAAIQIAKALGAHVTAVCSTQNLALVKSLGADVAVDYTNDFSDSGATYDIIYDAVGKSPFSKCVASLQPTGYYLRMVHMDLASILKGIWVSATSRKKVIGGVAKVKRDDLAFLNQLVIQGKLRPVVDKIFRMEDVVQAHRYVEAGHKKGNVVLTFG
jgi:NADPH:quinone reductase-like Zn-dependent oxidoreductase